MQLATVTGNATSTVKHPSLVGHRLLICQVVDGDRKAVGEPMLTLDHHGAGVGDLVMLSSDGKGLRQLLGSNTSPARWWTLGMVDPPEGSR
ncbi:MAG: EutN/CcmL family microcompartment protein [Planctomycetota bacterium]